MENDVESPVPELNKKASPMSAPPPSSGFQKLKGYVGVLVVLVIAGFFFSPSDSRRTLGYQINYSKSYIQNTILSEHVSLNWRTQFVKTAMKPIYRCNRANGSLKSYPESTTARSVLEACDRFESLHPYGQGRSRVLEIDNEYQMRFDKLSDLRVVARNQQGLGEAQTPVPTPEMYELDQQLVQTMDKNIEQIRLELSNLNLAAHALLLALTGLGLWYRRGIGAVLLAPFGWMFSLGKGVHEKI